MTPDLDAIEARITAATPGPWTVAETEGWVGVHPVCPPHGTDDAAEISGGLADLSAADADLIAAAPTDLSALLTELRATTADLAVAVEVARERGEEVERLRAVAEALRDEIAAASPRYAVVVDRLDALLREGE